ncbi:MAG: ATP-dependent helicase, partial [Leifsonia flava]
ETLRECLQDVYDLPSLLSLAREIGSRGIRLVETTTDSPSPFASTLLFGYVGAFMYEGDSPLAERRAAALAIDSTLLAELLGRVELRELLDPAVIDDTERELQRLAPDRRAKGLEGIADLLRGLGALSVEEISARVTAETLPDVAEHVDELLRAKRIIRTAVAGTDRLAAIEDVGRLRDALGVPIQVGVPEAYLEAVADPLGDLISRYARTHGPFATEEVAERLGIGTAVARSALRRLVEARRLVEGEFRPNGTSAEWCDAEVLRRLRRRSLAALRHEIEPVEQRALARFLPVWQHVGGRLRGLDGVASVIEQLEGARLPASAWESLVLPARVSDYSPAMLDELMATGEVVWCGSGALAGDDGWISLHLADTAALTLPISLEAETTPLQREVLASLGSGGAFFFRQLSDAVGSEDDSALVDALWDLAWSGLVTNDTFAPVRALVAGGHSAHKPQRAAPRARMHRGRALPRAKMPSRGGPPTVAGRWSILPLPDSSATRRAHALGETLLERYGVVTRGAAVAEGVIGGFALVYRTLREFEESGRSRRGYFVDKLGAAQFAAPGAVDRLRSHVDRDDGSTPSAPVAFTLAATDPANPFGAALAWPALPEGTTHRPARKAGALVVLVDGTIALYVERGGKTMLAFTDDEAVLAAAAASLAAAVSRGGMRKLAVETVNGLFVLGAPAGLALRGAGFSETPRGLRLSARV